MTSYDLLLRMPLSPTAPCLGVHCYAPSPQVVPLPFCTRKQINVKALKTCHKGYRHSFSYPCPLCPGFSATAKMVALMFVSIHLGPLSFSCQEMPSFPFHLNIPLPRPQLIWPPLPLSHLLVSLPGFSFFVLSHLTITGCPSLCQSFL